MVFYQSHARSGVSSAEEFEDKLNVSVMQYYRFDLELAVGAEVVASFLSFVCKSAIAPVRVVGRIRIVLIPGEINKGCENEVAGAVAKMPTLENPG